MTCVSGLTYLTDLTKENSRSKSVKFFNENLFNELMSLWLQNNAGLNIVSVHSTLIQTILDTITQGYEQNLSVQDISRLLQQQGFYRAQSLRIARTDLKTRGTSYCFGTGMVKGGD